MTEPKNFYFLQQQSPGKTRAGGGGVVDPSETSALSPSGAASPPASGPLSWLSGLFGRRAGYQSIDSKLRKVPTKVEPKVFFANERTFLAWLHMAVTLSSISVAIIAFAEANEWSQVYGLLLMPVAISFCAYALYMYMKRAIMIRTRHPGPYEDKVGPVVLSAMLATAIIVNFCINLFS